jgi:hypothetical protein
VTEFLSRDELLALLKTEEEREPGVVFVAPTATDKGYHKRRVAQLDFMKRRTLIATEVAKLQAKMERYRHETEAAQKALDEADEADKTAAQARVDALTDQMTATLASLDGMMERQQAFLGEQVEFLLPFIGAIRYPAPNGAWTYKKRPKDDVEAYQAFQNEARGLLAETTEEDFERMLEAVVPSGGQTAVPPKSGGK